MSIRINNIKMPLDAEFNEIKAEALKKIGEHSCLDFKIIKQSVDARRKSVCFVYSAAAELEDESKIEADGVNIIKFVKKERKVISYGEKELEMPPVVVGSGPCGLFCALTLARYGFNPIVLERGADVDTRTEKVNRFFNDKKLDVNTNIQFGEGGAGTFSDGKLTTRINDELSDFVIEDFVRFGADEEILYKAKPHIGTDVLKKVVKNIRKEIIRLGGTVRFNSKLSDIEIKNGRITGVKVDDGSILPCCILVLAIGHSARDTYEMLFKKGVKMEQKPFSVGFRIEHLQSFINERRYGEFAGNKHLKTADYQLSYRENNVGCYSFCMCPGGTVVAAASEENMVVTNGMSEFMRDKTNANSAICVSVDRKNFLSGNPLSGIEFQRQLERKAFLLGGGNYNAPVQLATDYINGRVSDKISSVVPSYTAGTCFADLNNCFDSGINYMMKKGLLQFNKKIKGFVDCGAVLTGVETRTSAPVRITRNNNFESEAISGLYPSGEGAGYAGGIMSAAVDGIKAAQNIISEYKI